jgi:hypothetical protein
MRPMRFLLLAAGALMLAPRSLQADVPGYKVQTIARSGDTIGNLKILANGYFGVGSLNDGGQIAFVAQNAAGGEMLLQYNGGRFIPIVAGGQDAPDGKWSRSLSIWSQVQMNQQGDVVFEAGPINNTYLWSHRSGRVSIVAAKGMPAVNDLTFTGGGNTGAPAINDYGEVAFQATVKDSAGKTQGAIFFRDRDGKLVPVLLPGQAVEGVGPIEARVWNPTYLNNAGVVGFNAGRPGDKSHSVFLWEKGTITPAVLVGTDAPGGGKFLDLGGGLVNNKNRNVEFWGNLDGNLTHWGDYMLIGGQLVPFAVPGQEMPGGGKYAMMSVGGDSYPSSAGESAFIAPLEGGDSGAYRVDADGNLSLIVKGSDLGAKIVLPSSWGIGINGKGQVALPVRFTGDKFDALILLTPSAPPK